MMVLARIPNLLGNITILVVVSLCVNTTLALDGSGTQEDPWRIKSLEDFNDFAADANYWDDYTRLETDVNLAGMVYERAVIAPDVNFAEGWFQGTPFSGVFDGNDHKVLNMTIDNGSVRSWYLGLFGQIYNGEVRNLGLEGCYISGDAFFVGGLVSLNNGIVSNCYSTGDVSGDSTVGGLVGENNNNVSNCYTTGTTTGHWAAGGLVGDNNENSSMSNCYSTGTVSGYERTGGLVGINNGIIWNCFSTSDVNADFGFAGGLVGWNLTLSYYGNVSFISNCYSTGDVNGHYTIGGLVGVNGWDEPFDYYGYIYNSYSIGTVNGISKVGGLVGENMSEISNCYSTGNVTGEDTVGGLVGYNGLINLINVLPGYIDNSYATGNVQGNSNVGGLVGYNEHGAIEKSYWDIETSTEPNMCGYQEPNATGCDPNYGKTTTEMQQQSTFIDWDFINVWNIGENQTYPYLRTFFAGDINKDGIVNFLDMAITANQWMEGVE